MLTRSPVTLRWLRGVRRLMLLLIGAPVGIALAYTWRSAWRADVVGAGAGVLCTAWLRLGMALLRDRRHLERLERRLDALSTNHRERLAHLVAEQERLRGQAEQGERRLAELLEQSRESDRQTQQRIASLQARIETFCKLHDDQADRLDRRIARLEGATRRAAGPADVVNIADSHWASEDTPPGERTVSAFQHLVGQAGAAEADTAERGRATSERQQLALEFASLIHRRDYAAALAKGDEIAGRFPDSTAAADFRRVRPHLVRKIQLLETVPAGRGR